MAAKVVRPCQRNDCPAPARAGVELSHADKVAVLVDLPAERDPRRMELCADHASGMSVPRGWTRVDDREVEDDPPPQGPPTVAEITSLSTLEVLAAALESDPEPATSDLAAVASDIAEPGDTEPGDGPSTAAVMAATLARVPRSSDEPESEVLEEVTQDGTQLVLAAADRLARQARPVPAARTD